MEKLVQLDVTVTFLRMEAPPQDPALPWPRDAQDRDARIEVRRVEQPSVAFYRALYDAVGRSHCWWLRRTMPDATLAALLRDPLIELHVLSLGGEPAGFAELDRRAGPDVNLAYFGLVPQALGRGLGRAFLRHAIDIAWDGGARALTVNTCTADHPRALPNYLRAGFTVTRRVRETWDVPERLGLPIPDTLR